jgi:hypothetical protein
MINPIYRPSIRKIDRGYHIEITDKEQDLSFIINVYGGLNNHKFGKVTRLEITGFDDGVAEVSEPGKDFKFQAFLFHKKTDDDLTYEINKENAEFLKGKRVKIVACVSDEEADDAELYIGKNGRITNIYQGIDFYNAAVVGFDSEEPIFKNAMNEVSICNLIKGDKVRIII